MYGIFTYIWAFFLVNVGKYSSTMEHLGTIQWGFKMILSIWDFWPINRGVGTKWGY